MRFFRRGQHQPITRGPIPPDDTSPIPRIRTGLLAPPGTPLQAAQASTHAAWLAMRPRMLPAPITSPASVPPLKPAPPRPRQAWAPAPPAAPPPPPRITEPAALAYPGGRVPPELTLPCATCHRVHTRGATSSFTALYATAAAGRVAAGPVRCHDLPRLPGPAWLVRPVPADRRLGRRTCPHAGRGQPESTPLAVAESAPHRPPAPRRAGPPGAPVNWRRLGQTDRWWISLAAALALTTGTAIGWALLRPRAVISTVPLPPVTLTPSPPVIGALLPAQSRPGLVLVPPTIPARVAQTAAGTPAGTRSTPPATRTTAPVTPSGTRKSTPGGARSTPTAPVPGPVSAPSRVKTTPPATRPAPSQATFTTPPASQPAPETSPAAPASTPPATPTAPVSGPPATLPATTRKPGARQTTPPDMTTATTSHKPRRRPRRPAPHPGRHDVRCVPVARMGQASTAQAA